MTDATEATKSADCLAPASPWDTALAQHLAGRLAEAEAGYRGILTAEPANAEALHMLGVLYFQSGQASEGLELLEAAIAIDDRSAPLHSHRGLILAALGRAGEAVQAYRAGAGLESEHGGDAQQPGESAANLGRLAWSYRSVSSGCGYSAGVRRSGGQSWPRANASARACRGSYRAPAGCGASPRRCGDRRPSRGRS